MTDLTHRFRRRRYADIVELEEAIAVNEAAGWPVHDAGKDAVGYWATYHDDPTGSTGSEPR